MEKPPLLNASEPESTPGGGVASDQRFAWALEFFGDGVWDWDIAGRRVLHNGQCCHLLGLGDTAMYHPIETFTAHLFEADRAVVLGRIKGALGQEGHYYSEHRMVRADGKVIWVEERGRVVERSAQGKALRMVGTVRDVTGAKSAQARDRLFSDTMEASLLGIYIIQDLKFQYANTAYAAMFGYTPEDLMSGMGPGDLIAPDKRAQVLENLRRRAQGEPGKPYEVEGMRQDGSTFPLLVWGKGVEYQGRPASVGTAVDISERKALEAELRDHRDHLEELVAERTAELVASRIRAEQLARARSDFLANMSHEIRTPLNAVLGFARIGMRDNMARASQQTFSRIVDAGQHLLGVVNDILDFSKLDAGKLSVEREPFDLPAVLSNAASLVSGAAARKGLAFAVEMGAGVPQWVAGDAHRLQQILVNLLANGVKFTERGEVRLRVTGVADEVVFQVVDTGVGISEEQLSRLFRPFEQADSSTTRRFGGTGLGLAISRELAQLMGGGIHVESIPGQGSTFTLRVQLPKANPPHTETRGPSAPPGARLTGLRLLAAEDSEVNRIILEQMLVYEGARVGFAENGRQALERVQTAGPEAFDLVLMDVQMPVMDGFEATRALRALAPDLPVVGLTAYALPDERERCLAAGMAEHVTKPIDPEALVQAILRRSRRRPAEGVAPSPAAPPAEQAMENACALASGTVDWPALLETCQGRQDFVDRLLSTMQRNHVQTPAELRNLAEKGDWPALAKMAHLLKSLTGSLMAKGLYDLSIRLEQAALARSPETDALASRLADGLDTMLKEIDARLGSGAMKA